jgi:hypothetical protein
VNQAYVSLAVRLDPETMWRLGRNELRLAALYAAYRRSLADRHAQQSPEPSTEPSTDERVDALVAQFGADAIMRGLDRVTAPQREVVS